MSENFSARELLIATAHDYGVNLVRLREKFDECKEGMRSSYTHVSSGVGLNYIALENAVAAVTDHENTLFAGGYARAFLRDDYHTLARMRGELNALPQDRQDTIKVRTAEKVRIFCQNTSLPELRVAFTPDNGITHPTLSADDASTFGVVFRARSPKADEFLKKSDDMRSKEGRKLLIKGFKSFRQSWESENGALNFPSLTNAEERREYDRDRGQPNYVKASWGGGRISRLWQP